MKNKMEKLPESFYWLQVKVTISLTSDTRLNLLEVICNAAGLIKGLKECKSFITSIDVYSYLCDNEVALIDELPAPIFNDLAEEFLEIMRKEDLAPKVRIHYAKEWV
jgi:AAA15 family ATPase/GTPase